MTKLLFKNIDNSPLLVFRIIFGFLIAAEAIGACFTGWIKKTLIEPEFTFNFIGFDFLQPLPGEGMYYYYIIMGLLGIMVMVGYRYRLAMLGYALMWSSVYLMQKASYNNHYYLLMLLCFIMCLLPAHKNYSIDAKLNPEIKTNAMPLWCKLVIITQISIVYTYAAIAKLYPDWLNGIVTKNLMNSRAHLYCFDGFCLGSLLKQEWLYFALMVGGILFDLLIVPLMLYKHTRKLAFVLSIVFHIFNAFVFQIGIFPFLSLSFALFFFPAKKIHALFLKKKPFYTKQTYSKPNRILVGCLAVYFIIQIGLPLRHWFIQDNVLWTEEGHRLSWRMMLRSKSGIIKFKVVDNQTKDTFIYNHEARLSKKQLRIIATKPDVIWQFVQRLHAEFKAKGKDVSIYAETSLLNVNNRGYEPFIDPAIDLTKVKWDPFKHSDWILPSKNLP